MDVKILPSKIKGEIKAPPSKSYAHRYVIASFLSGESVEVKGAGNSFDVLATLNALSSVGLKYSYNEDVDVTLTPPKSLTDNCLIDCKESGSTIRFLFPVMSALGVKCQFTGSQRLLQRPMKDIVECLNQNGADITGFCLNGRLKSGNFTINGQVSSQFITGLLFALPILEGDSRIKIIGQTVSKDYINITLDVLNKFGIEIEKTNDGYFVKGNQKYHSPKNIVVEGDYSGSAFMFCMGAIGGEVVVKNLNHQSLQGDKRILEALKSFGANVNEVTGGYKVQKGNLKGITIDCQHIPDIVQVLSVVAGFAQGKTQFTNVSRLEIKESDRIAGIIKNLSLAGIKAEYLDGNLTVYGCDKIHAGQFLGENDHRTVMSATVLALNCSGESVILGAEAINKSFPSFFEQVKILGGKVTNV